MTPLKDRLILTDCDNVLLDWTLAFNFWMRARGHELKNENTYDIALRYEIDKHTAHRYVLEFNSSPEIGILPVLGDAATYVRKLHDFGGFDFLVITCLSDDPVACRRRKINLYNAFGAECIRDVVCLPIGSPKDEELDKYRDSGCWWLEDKPEYAMAGRERGLRPILMNQPHNKDFETNIPRVDNWAQIYEMIAAR